MTLKEIFIREGKQTKRQTNLSKLLTVALQSDNAHKDLPNAHRDEIAHIDRHGRIHALQNDTQHHVVHQGSAHERIRTFTAADGRTLELPIGKKIVVEYKRNQPLICRGGHVIRAVGHLEPKEQAPTLRLGSLQYTGRMGERTFKHSDNAQFLIGVINGIKIFFEDGKK